MDGQKNELHFQCEVHKHGKKGKVIPLHAMEVHGVRGGIAHTHS
jgi:hypothetical protein